MPPLHEGGGGILFYLCPSVRPSFRPSKIFFVAFFSVRQLLWVAFLDPSDSYFLLADLVSLHIQHICTFFVTFFSATIDGRDLIFGHKLYIGTPYRGKRFFFIRQIPTFCLPKSGGIIGELMLTVHLVYTVNTKYGLRKVTIVNDIMSSVCLRICL